MSHRTKQMLACEARKAAQEDFFVPVLLLSDEDPCNCSQEQYLELLKNLEQLCNKKAAEEREVYIENVYHRMLDLLSRKMDIPFDRIVSVVKQVVMYHPTKAILTFDDLKQFNIQLEKRSVIIHFDMSGSMSCSGFDPLVRTIIGFCARLQNQDIQVHVSLFGGDTQEKVHNTLGGRLLTLDEFSKENYRPSAHVTLKRRKNAFSLRLNAFSVSNDTCTASKRILWARSNAFLRRKRLDAFKARVLLRLD
ncbi:hypothetical protein I4U23_016518 [Adineta vaga]|nr:hypothetical protein I4U23_016518 [Adineta vaga]